MSIAYGAGLILSEMMDEIGRTIRLIFQPAEKASSTDSLSGARYIGGARPMIDEGWLKGMDNLIGLHVHPRLREEFFGWRENSGLQRRLFRST